MNDDGLPPVRSICRILFNTGLFRGSVARCRRFVRHVVESDSGREQA